MVKVVHLITGLVRGGAETALYRLLAGMDRDRFENVVVSLTEAGAMAADIRALGVPVHAVRMSRAAPGPAAAWRLLRRLRAERPDILQTWLYHADLAGLVAGRLARVPAIAWNVRCAETDARYRRGLGGLVVRLLARLSSRPDVVVVNSEAGRRVHAALGYRPRRWLVAANGFDTALFRPDPAAPAALREALGLAPDCPVIGLVARYDPLKDHATFLRAAALLAGDEPEVRFVLVGAGADDGNPTLTGLVGELGLGGRVRLLGERRDVPALTAGFDIAACSSVGEGFPNVVGEAMACAVPCVATDVGDSAALVGETGRVVPPGDPGAMAAAWRELLEMGPAGRAELGRAARRRIEEEFTLAAAVGRYEALYAELAGSASGGAPSSR